jgi:hypothetical protein
MTVLVTGLLATVINHFTHERPRVERRAPRRSRHARWVGVFGSTGTSFT